MRIQTNTASLFAQRSLSQGSARLGRSFERMATGLRINSAKDDAAGLAISNRMTAQIRGQNQAVRNMNDGLSMLQTTEAALNQVTSSLQRIRELAVQAANDTNSISDRRALQGEVTALVAEVERVIEQTTFNGQQVLVGRPDSTLSNAELALVTDLKGGWLQRSEELVATYFGLNADGVDLDIEITAPGTPGGVAAFVSGVPDGVGRLQGPIELNIDLADYQNIGDTYDRVIAHEMAHAVMARTMSFANLPLWFIEGTAEFLSGADDRLSADIGASSVATIDGRVDTLLGGAWAGTSQDYSAAYVAVRYLHDEIKSAGGSGIRDVMDYLSANLGADLDEALQNIPNGSYAGGIADLQTAWNAGTTGVDYINGMDLTNADLGAIGGFDADGGAVRNAADIVADGPFSEDPLTGFNTLFPEGDSLLSSERFTLQVGANRGDTIGVAKVAASIERMQLDDLDLTTDASGSIAVADAAISRVTAVQTEMGAAMNRVESSIRSALAAKESASAARSRIQDADFARETAELTRGRILQQASTSILAQANVQPQQALVLLNA